MANISVHQKIQFCVCVLLYTMFFYNDGRVLMRVMIFGDELLGSSKDAEYVIYLGKYQPIMQSNDSLFKYFAVTQDGMLHLLTDDKKYISNSCDPLISYNQSDTCSIPLKPDN